MINKRFQIFITSKNIAHYKNERRVENFKSSFVVKGIETISVELQSYIASLGSCFYLCVCRSFCYNKVIKVLMCQTLRLSDMLFMFAILILLSINRDWNAYSKVNSKFVSDE